MRITVNGEIFNTSKDGTITDLLSELQVNPARVAVEVNLTIIKKSEYQMHRLCDGDKVEIVNFVGGG